MQLKKYLTPKEVACELNISISSLTAYRANEIGLNYIKLGRLVRYEISNIYKWQEEKNKKSKKKTLAIQKDSLIIGLALYNKTTY